MIPVLDRPDGKPKPPWPTEFLLWLQRRGAPNPEHQKQSHASTRRLRTLFAHSTLQCARSVCGHISSCSSASEHTSGIGFARCSLSHRPDVRSVPPAQRRNASLHHVYGGTSQPLLSRQKKLHPW